MKKLLTLATLALGLALPAAQAQETRIGRLAMPWLDGYTLAEGSDPHHFSGPGGVDVLVTVWGLDPEASPDAGRRMEAALADIAERQLPDLAAAQGTVVQSLSRQSLPGGSTLYGTAIQSGTADAPRFYLQFMLVSPSEGAALFTIEGPGGALEAYPHFLEQVGSVNWAKHP